jgi:hypothetical protein
MKTNTSASLLFSLALLGAGSLFAQTATTPPVGFTTLAVPVGTSLVVPTLNNDSLWQGQAAVSGDGLTITPTAAPNWVANAFNKTAFNPPVPNYPTHYAEVVAGAQEGLVIDISTNSATALTIPAGEISVASGIRGTTVTIAVRKHVTIAKVIEGATGLTAGEDSVSVFNNPTNHLPTVCYYDGGTSFLDSNLNYDVGHTVVYPGTGFSMSVAAPVSLTFLGSVKITKTQVNMFASSTNIVGPLNPSSSTKFYGNSIIPYLTPGEDGINNFNTVGNMLITGTYYTDGTQMLDNNLNPLPPASTDAIPLNRGVVVTVVNDTIWVVPPVPVAP